MTIAVDLRTSEHRMITFKSQLEKPKFVPDNKPSLRPPRSSMEIGGIKREPRTSKYRSGCVSNSNISIPFALLFMLSSSNLRVQRKNGRREWIRISRYIYCLILIFLFMINQRNHPTIEDEPDRDR